LSRSRPEKVTFFRSSPIPATLHQPQHQPNIGEGASEHAFAAMPFVQLTVTVTGAD
jgi:hypothetical protein